jgi:hypothetical protein
MCAPKKPEPRKFTWRGSYVNPRPVLGLSVAAPRPVYQR